MRKINPEIIERAVYNAVRTVLRNPMPRGAVCTPGEEVKRGKSVVRYQRGSIDSTLKAAVKSSHTSGKIKYVFATYSGFTIWPSKPPIGQDYYKVSPDGEIELIESNFPK